MRECAFCSETAKLSAEHIFGSWVSGLFAGKWEGKFTNKHGQVNEWSSTKLDWKARVVCETCNNTWMSEIENKHAKPTMSPLIDGGIGIPISHASAQSLSLFAFKTAVVLDCSQRGRDHNPFFSQRLRHAFRKHHNIPNTVQMWMAVYAPGSRRVDTSVGYYKANLLPTYPIDLFVCTCAIGNFAFQVVASKQMGFELFTPNPDFGRLAIPLWPQTQPKFVWPGNPPNALRSVEQFIEFHRRWEGLAHLQRL